MAFKTCGEQGVLTESIFLRRRRFGGYWWTAMRNATRHLVFCLSYPPKISFLLPRGITGFSCVLFPPRDYSSSNRIAPVLFPRSPCLIFAPKWTPGPIPHSNTVKNSFVIWRIKISNKQCMSQLVLSLPWRVAARGGAWQRPERVDRRDPARNPSWWRVFIRRCPLAGWWRGGDGEYRSGRPVRSD